MTAEFLTLKKRIKLYWEFLEIYLTLFFTFDILLKVVKDG